jgi:hypothetical protein
MMASGRSAMPHLLLSDETLDVTPEDARAKGGDTAE